MLGTGLAVLGGGRAAGPEPAGAGRGRLALAACVAAAAIRRPLAGTVALAATTVTVLLAGALDASSVRPAQVVLAAGLLMALLAALAAAEEARAAGGAVTVTRSRGRSGWRRSWLATDGRRNRRRHGCPGRRTLGSVGPRRSDCRGGRPRGRCERAPHAGAGET